MSGGTSGRGSAGRAFAGLVTSNVATMFLIAGSGVYTVAAMDEFATPHFLGLTFTLENLARCVMLPLAGNLGNRFGRRRLFLAAEAAYLGAAALCALAPAAAPFVAGRALMGLAWGLFMGNSFAMVADLYAAKEGTRRTGYMQSAGLLAMLAAAPLTGVFADQLTWRLAFWVTLGPLAAAWLLVASGMPASSRGRRGPVDLAGAALLAGALAPFAWAMALGGRALPWASPAMAALLGASLASVVGLVLAERRSNQPIFPPAVLASRPLLLVLAVTVCFNVVGAAGEFLPAFAQSALGTSAAVSGLLALPGLVVAAVGSSLLGRRLAARRRYRGVVLSWAAALVAVTAVYATFSPETALAWVFGAAGVMGLAQTATQVVPYTYPMLALKPEQVPSGIAVMTFAGSAANTVGAGLLTAAANTGLANVFRVPIVFGLLALAAALAFRDPKRP